MQEYLSSSFFSKADDFYCDFGDFCKKSGNDSEESSPKVEMNYASSVFQLPIEYVDNSKKHKLSSTVASDLELVLGESPAYDTLLQPTNLFSKQIIGLYQTHFTTDVDFLMDSQQVIQNYVLEEPDDTIVCETIQQQWCDVKHTPGFKETYGYMDWSILESMNHSSLALQGITLSNMLSPLMSFFIPFLFFLFPFIILKIQGVPISFSVYFDVLKNIAKHHFIGKAIATFENFSLQNFIYLMAMLGLYCLQMYQNTTQCIRFYRNIQKVNNELVEWKRFVNHSIHKMENYLSITQSLHTYASFRHTIQHHLSTLRRLKQDLEPIYGFQCSIMKTTDIGYMLKVYYELHSDELYEQALVYSMGFYGYCDHLSQLKKKWAESIINIALYCGPETVAVYDESNNKVPECVIEEQYYYLQESDGVRNDVILDNFGVITGPNASGKTTYLKTTAINVILSQQFGVGFYKSCTLRPYSHIHSYLNIPDTSGRDSLFQAESRRCKEILTQIQEDNARQFCIFDELYSGTNPKEATKSAYAFLEYLRQYSHVDLFLTTHYVSICDQWTKADENKREIHNYQMVVDIITETVPQIKVDDNIDEIIEDGEKTVEKIVRRIPTYKIAPGVSHIEGALGILEDMAYPEEMIDMIRKNDTVITI